MSDLQQKIRAALQNLKLDGLSSAWRKKNSDLGKICSHLHMNKNSGNRLKIYLSYQKKTVITKSVITKHPQKHLKQALVMVHVNSL